MAEGFTGDWVRVEKQGKNQKSGSVLSWGGKGGSSGLRSGTGRHRWAKQVKAGRVTGGHCLEQDGAGWASHQQGWTRVPGSASFSRPGDACPASPPAPRGETVHLPKSKEEASH